MSAIRGFLSPSTVSETEKGKSLVEYEGGTELNDREKKMQRHCVQAYTDTGCDIRRLLGQRVKDERVGVETTFKETLSITSTQALSFRSLLLYKLSVIQDRKGLDRCGNHKAVILISRCFRAHCPITVIGESRCHSGPAPEVFQQNSKAMVSDNNLSRLLLMSATRQPKTEIQS